MFDDVREKIVVEHDFDKYMYVKYLNRMLALVPMEYRIFYYDISSGVDGELAKVMSRCLNGESEDGETKK
jgi:hypothetical protein